jgi:polysaccharide biosynthesis transport protein
MPGQISDATFPEPSGEDFDLQKWIHILLENRWWIIGVTTFFVVLSVIYSFLVTPIYSATATVYVQSQGRQFIGNQNFIGTTSWLEEEKFYNSQAQVITSKAVAQEVVDRLNLQEHPAFKGLKDPAQAFRGLVKVEAIRDSALFKITVTSSYQKDVAVWANAVAEVYANQNLKNALELLSRANAIMLDQAKKLQEDYSRQQKQLTGELAQAGSYFPQNQKEIVDKGIQDLESKLREVRVQQSEVGAILGQMQAWRAKGGDPLGLPAVAQDTTAQDLAKQTAEMDRDLAKLEVKLTPEHPEVKKKKKEIEAVKPRLNHQAVTILTSYQNRYAQLKGEESNLMEQLDTLKRQGLRFVEGSSKGEVMETSTAAIKKYMDLIYDKMREMNISGSLLTNNIRVVDLALTPGGPIKPKKMMNTLMALVLGLMLSLGTLVAYHFIDNTIKSVEEVEMGLGLNLLTMVPTLGQETERATVEAFQSLRTALVYASQNGQKNVVLVTSANPKEGKTSVITNLANVMAAGGDRVLLIDCDLRRPSIYRFLSADSGRKGLTHYLAEREGKIEDYIGAGNRPNLSVIFSGPIPPNPPELFSMKRFKDLIGRLRSQYDWVLMDSPPCLSITDAQLLASLCDLVLVVARYRKTPKPLLQRAVVTLKRLNAQVAGVVLNDVETQSSYYYDYYYSSHYYYSTGMSPKRIPWILGKVGEWQQLWKGFSASRRRGSGHRG